MKRQLVQVTPEDFDVDELRQALREGRLYIDTTKKISPEEVINYVRTYIKPIRSLVTPAFRTSIDALWNDIFHCDELLNLLMPTSKARKFNDFNKYGVMGIICVLRSNGVYEEYNDSKYDTLLEPRENGSRYRRSLGQGLSQDLCSKVRDIVKKYKL